MKFLIIFILTVISLTYAVPVEKKWNDEDLLNKDKPFTVDDLAKFGLDVASLDAEVVNDIIEDANLKTPGLLKKYGYKVEIHHVHTADGYILEMHRIPKPGAIPIYMQHGIMDSSAGWVLMGPKQAFAYRLADLGYDVWLGNIRGNRYSRNHTYLNPDGKDFWDFSFHEIGMLDVPAMLDHVIKTTGFPKVHYIGHSQGTTAFWVMCSVRPEYCDKVLSMQAMAPIAFLRYVRSPIIRFIAPFTTSLDFIFKLFGQHEFQPNDDFFKYAGYKLCNEEAITQDICMNSIFLVTGYNSEQLNRTMLPVVLAHLPAGSSTKQFVHYGQLVNSGRFRMYDYGLINNRKKYGTFSPPSYDLSKVTAPVALHFSLNDWLAHEKDVRKLQDKLPNVIKDYQVPSPKFNHLDFLLAINSREMVQNEVIRVMKVVESKMN